MRRDKKLARQAARSDGYAAARLARKIGELKVEEKRAAKRADGFNSHGQFETRFPDAPEDVAGVGRTVSRGMP